MRPEQERELKRILDEAFRAFESGDDATARRLCRDALAIDPDSSTAHSLMGLIYDREGRAAEASGEFARVVTLNPNSEAERRTLRRLRGQRSAEPLEAEGERPSGAIIAVAAVAALVVFASIFLASRMISHWIRDKSENNVIVASANVEEDLALAREAFDAGRYQTAMEASARVLRVEPDNQVAREIFERSRAFLRGTEQPPTPPAAQTAPAPVQTVPQPVQSQPAIPRAGAPAVAVAGNGAPVTPSAPARILAPGLPVAPAPVLTPAPAANSRYRPALRPRTSSGLPRTAYDRTARQRAAVSRETPVPTRPPAVTSYDDIAPPEADPAVDNRATSIGETAAPEERRPDSYIKIEVTPRQPSQPTEAAPEVTPSSGSAPAPATRPGTTSPAAERSQEQQRRLREARERNAAAARRRAEQEQNR